MYYPPWWNSTVTVYHKETSQTAGGPPIISWSRTVYRNCYRGQTQKQHISEYAQVSADVEIVRIPAPAVIGKGDIVLDGEISALLKNGASGNELLSTYSGFRVETCKHNVHDTLPMPHEYGGDGNG